MGLKDWLIALFYEEVDAEEKPLENVTSNDREVLEKEYIKIKESKSGLPIYGNVDNNLKRNLEILKAEKNDLPLDGIKSEAQIVNNIIDDLKQDLEALKNTEHRKEELASVASTRVKNITIRGLQLKKLIGEVETRYYSKLIDLVKKANMQFNNGELDVVLDQLETNNNTLKDLQEDLGNLMVYDYKLNSEKNDDFVNAINQDLEEFSNYLINLQGKLSSNVLLNGGLRAKLNVESTIEQAIFILD